MIYVRQPGYEGPSETEGCREGCEERGEVSSAGVEWLAPTSLEEALSVRAERGDEATVVAGGTFLGILMNQGFLSPSAIVSLAGVPELREIEVVEGELRLGAMVTHRRLERDGRV